jgi:isocitrate dehydrogenase (NAD+)
VFEAVHGSAPDIAGQNKANPIALLQSALLMLDYLEERTASKKIHDAMIRVLEEGKVRTRDLGGDADTTVFTAEICRLIEAS